MKDTYLLILRIAYILVIILFVFYLNCATRGRPGGGPVDKIPPEIIETFPAPDSTGLSNLEKVEIYFSERMNESSVENSLFISPPLEYETDWSGGDEFTLSIKDTLAADHTYVITIGSGAMDMQKNRMADSYQFAFSSGKFIDKGEIYGRVYNITKKDLFYVYAYKKVNPDSLNPTRVTADFLSQPGPDGKFWLKYLPIGNYRVFVVEDQNKNLLLDSAYERVGIPTRDASVDTSKGPVGPLNFRVTRIDTTLPDISGARSIDNRTIQLRINEEVKHLNPQIISIVDTLSADTLEIKGITRNEEEPKQFLVFTALQDSGRGYRLSVEQLVDTSGNVQNNPQVTQIVGTNTQDTTHFELLRVVPKDSTTHFSLSALIQLGFSLPIDTGTVTKTIQILDRDSVKVAGDWNWAGLKGGSFRPDKNWYPGQIYTYSFSTKYIKSLWGDTLTDSTLTRTFFTMPEDEFGSLTGDYVGTESIRKDIYVQLIPIEQKKKSYKVIVDENKSFKFSWVLEGKYKLGGFIDLDSDRKYSPGSLFPFNFSEPFTTRDDTLRIRKRWEVSDKRISIPGSE